MKENLEAFWITPRSNDLVSLSFRSKTAFPEWSRVSAHEMLYPENVTEAEKKHVTVLSFLSHNDLEHLYNRIGSYLRQSR